MTKATSKTKINFHAFAEAGFRNARLDAETLAMFTALAAKDINRAGEEWINGHIAAALNPAATALTVDLLAKAKAICALKTLVIKKGEKAPSDAACAKEGRRNASEQRMHGNAVRSFNRFRDAAGFKPRSKKGRKKGQKIGAQTEETAHVETGSKKQVGPVSPIAIGKVAKAVDLAAGVNTLRGAFSALMVNGKACDLTADESALSVEITRMMNELSVSLAKHK